MTRCNCPIYCRFCGAKLRRDHVGHFCPTKNCQWQHAAETCVPESSIEDSGGRSPQTTEEG